MFLTKQFILKYMQYMPIGICIVVHKEEVCPSISIFCFCFILNFFLAEGIDLRVRSNSYTVSDTKTHPFHNSQKFWRGFYKFLSIGFVRHPPQPPIYFRFNFRDFLVQCFFITFNSRSTLCSAKVTDCRRQELDVQQHSMITSCFYTQ